MTKKTLESKLLSEIENDYFKIIDDLNYSLNDTVSYLVKTVLSIAQREKNIRVVILKDTDKKKDYKKIKDLQIQ